MARDTLDPVQVDASPSCRIGPSIRRAARTRPYALRAEDPRWRPLRIYTRDPGESVLDAAVAVVNVPYEPLEPGPRGQLFEVDSHDRTRDVRYRVVDLEDPGILIRDGREPSSTDPMFQQQMVYAVCSTVYAAFRKALGRDLSWGFDRPADEEYARLRILPHALETNNAYYDPIAGELVFGYYRAQAGSGGRNVEGGYVFTSLSHDIVAHEMTHALLDGLRSLFSIPTVSDVPAFHEGFADLVAIFSHFSHAEVVERAIRNARGDGEFLTSGLLTDIARQFGQTTGGGDRSALRSAILREGSSVQHYDTSLAPHALGSVLVTAVFEAFRTVFRRKVRRYIRLATGGSGVVGPGELPHDLVQILTRSACRLASQFLTICIRAIDYCPPVGMTFGEYLRALITADRDLVRDDPWGYREALVDAFRQRGIYPYGVNDLTPDALLWRPPRRSIAALEGLSFGSLQFDGDPAQPMDQSELYRQACVLSEFVSRDEHAEILGLAREGDPLLGGDAVSRPTVESVRTSRRVGPDGQIVFDLVAEVTQARSVLRDGKRFDFHGGSTLILGPRGEIRYVISADVTSERRLERQLRFMQSDPGRRFWVHDGSGTTSPRAPAFRLLHHSAANREEPSPA